MRFPARFLGDIPRLQVYLKPMDFLPSALAKQVESYTPDKSPGEGVKHMAALVGHVGSICDFFAPLGVRMLVVEDKQLVSWMQDRIGKQSVSELADEFADGCVKKMRGSAEVLDALYAKFIAGQDGAENPPQAECEFWVVVTDTDSLALNIPNIQAYGILTDRAGVILRDKTARPYVLAEIENADEFENELTRRLPRN